MGLKDIFTIRKPVESPQTFQQNDTGDLIAVISGVSYTAKGTKDAGFCGGDPKALLPKLHAVYMQLTRYIQQDEMKQNERKSKTRQEISGLEAKNANIESKIKAEEDKLAHEGSKIEKIIKEIDSIKENPKIISGDSFAKASFWIGLVIILFLTIYLFVFYSSASYSAFFKDFKPEDGNVFASVFDGQAIKKALTDENGGLFELIFILAIPAVFLGLGFLIHKFSEEKGLGKYLKISGLTVITFIFDFILAYKIVKEIDYVKDPWRSPPMSFGEVFTDPNFWAIIFAGFVVYIIWGLVFSFTMSEYEKMDKVRYTIRNKEQKLAEYKIECKQIKEKIANLQMERDSTQGDINKLRIQLENYVLYYNDVREGVNNYFTGWVGYLKATATSQAQIQECEDIKEKFLFDLKNSEFIKE